MSDPIAYMLFQPSSVQCNVKMQKKRGPVVMQISYFFLRKLKHTNATSRAIEDAFIATMMTKWAEIAYGVVCLRNFTKEPHIARIKILKIFSLTHTHKIKIHIKYSYITNKFLNHSAPPPKSWESCSVTSSLHWKWCLMPEKCWHLPILSCQTLRC